MGFEAAAEFIGEDLFAGAAADAAVDVGGSAIAEGVGGSALTGLGIDEVSAASGVAADGSLLSSAAGATGGAGSLGNVAQLGSAAYNLYQGQQLKNASNNLDPFSNYRAGFAEQLQALMANPSSVTTLPGYKAAEDSAQTALTSQLASQGLTGSGTAAAAIANQGAQFQNQYYQQQLATLEQLSGANFNNAGTALQGQVAGMNAQSNALNSLAKLIPSLSGGSGTLGGMSIPSIGG